MTQPSTASSTWNYCLPQLREALPPQQFNTWIKPLEASERETDGGLSLELLAPNRFIRDWVTEKFLAHIEQALQKACHGRNSAVSIGVLDHHLRKQAAQAGDAALQAARQSPDAREQRGWIQAQAGAAARLQPAANEVTRRVAHSDFGHAVAEPRVPSRGPAEKPSTAPPGISPAQRRPADRVRGSSLHDNLIPGYSFENFIEGESNEMALATAMQVVENPGGSYNPLFIYGGVGLGKTHLMHAVGNELKKRDPNAKVVYLHSERFVADMVKALQLNAIADFKRFYRSVDALLIDDIQFFANKDRSQDEFFHTFNSLLEGGQQMILTCDRYPKEIDGVEERLQSRFSWGLTIMIDPPELETRAAILMRKAEQARLPMPQEVAFFMAQRVRSNVRELEGALKRVIASANFTQKPVTIELVKEALKDLLALQDKQVSLDNIQKTVADYYRIKVSDLLSKRRNRSVARPRQMAMALAKELTNHSLPEIGDAFGGRDHTTVLHACRKIEELREENRDICEDYRNLRRTLAT